MRHEGTAVNRARKGRRAVHSYLVFIDRRDGSKGFCSRFSERDLRYLQRPRFGRSFDLENFKAYVDCDGFISLASKPDYMNHVTLNYAALWEHVSQARHVRHRNWAAWLSERLRDFGYQTITALVNRSDSALSVRLNATTHYKVSS